MTHRLLLTALLTTVAGTAVAQNASAPAAAAQPVSRTLYMQKVDEAFVAVDANKDGFMDRAEIEAAEVKAITARKAALLKRQQGLFQKLDANKDGSLTMQEFSAPVASAEVRKGNATPVVGRLDTNKDGKISLAENRVPSLAQFDRADANKDGALSAEERARTKR